MVKQLLHKIAHKIAKTFYKIELVRVEHKYGVVRRNRLNPFNLGGKVDRLNLIHLKLGTTHFAKFG
jgi:ABC-type sulfate transport system substrate-binding protein